MLSQLAVAIGHGGRAHSSSQTGREEGVPTLLLTCLLWVSLSIHKM